MGNANPENDIKVQQLTILYMLSNSTSTMIKNFYPSVLSVFLLLSGSVLSAQSVLLYQNDFESPLLTPTTGCSPDLDQRPINQLYRGTAEGTGGGGEFAQVNTVETILLNGPNNQYFDSLGLGGDYAIGMLATLQDDRLALTLNAQRLPFINLSLLLTPLNVPGCGGPFQLDTARLTVRIYDSPGGNFSFNSPGTLLDQDTLYGGAPALDSYSTAWIKDSASLDIIMATDSFVTVVFDALTSDYLVFDNVSISSSLTTSTVESAAPLLSVYPNPVHDRLRIDRTVAGGQLRLYNLLGRMVRSRPAGEGQSFIDVRDLPAGVYLLQYMLGQRRATYRIQKE
ncbi:MAG: T9SS type A sorting domain-containing protein [Lewinella sp.]